MPMLMQNAIAKMIQKPCEANAGLEICIWVFEPRSLPALAHYHPRTGSPVRLGSRRRLTRRCVFSTRFNASTMERCSLRCLRGFWSRRSGRRRIVFQSDRPDNR